MDLVLDNLLLVKSIRNTTPDVVRSQAQAAVDDPTNQTKKLAMVSMVRLPRSAAPAAQ